MKLRLLILLTFTYTAYSRPSHEQPSQTRSENRLRRSADEEAGEPLYLTPYLARNETEQAKEKSRVTPFIGDIESYSGYFTVNNQTGSHMFFWFFPSERNFSDAPFLLWLNGYQTSSIYGVFLQSGPYQYENKTFSLRYYSWQKWYNVLYIDNPLATGFSYVEDDEGLTTNCEQLGNNLYQTLQQFYKLFPEIRQNDFYITGLSLAGTHSTCLAHKIYRENKIAEDKINLKGLFIGNPYLNYKQIKNYAIFFKEYGFGDEESLKEFTNIENKFQNAAEENNFVEAFNLFRDGILDNNSFVANFTGLKNIYDITGNKPPSMDWLEFIQTPEARKALHVGQIPFQDGTKPYGPLKTILTFRTKPMTEEMLESIRMLYYCGQYDLSIPYPIVVNYLFSLNWSGANEYKKAKRNFIMKGDSAIAYIRQYGNLGDVMIRLASHSAISNQPKVVLDLLNKFTSYNY